MPSPFPGMDPYIESQCGWEGFHLALMAGLWEALNELLPDAYVVRSEERIVLVEAPDVGGRERRPDVLIAREPTAEEGPDWLISQPAPVATIEPATVTLSRTDPEEVRERWLEVRLLPDLTLITVIEVLSPHNKRGLGRGQHIEKRRELLDRPVHLVEIDLLLQGRRLPVQGTLPVGDYHVTVARAEARPRASVYAWSIRRPLPTIPIPLKAPDPDIPIDPAPVVARAYGLGRYQRTIRYAEALTLPLAPEDQAWVEALGRAAAC